MARYLKLGINQETPATYYDPPSCPEGLSRRNDIFLLIRTGQCNPVFCEFTSFTDLHEQNLIIDVGFSEQHIKGIRQSVNVVQGTSPGLKVKPVFADGGTSIGRTDIPPRGVLPLVNGPCNSFHRRKRKIML